MELIQQLMDKLGLDECTARSGLGLILKVAREKLDGSDLDSIKKLVPEADQLIEEAPSAGLLGGLGGLASSLGGKKNLGDLAQLLGGFSKLGIDKDGALKFAGVVGDFVQEHGDDKLKGLVSGLLDRV